MNRSSHLPGITHIYEMLCSDLPENVDMRSLSGLPIAIAASMREIPFHGEAICDTETIYNNNGEEEKATLSFMSNDRITARPAKAFVVTDVNGNHYLLGCKEYPFPIIGCRKTTGTPDGDAAVYQYEVTHVALRTAMECAI